MRRLRRGALPAARELRARHVRPSDAPRPRSGEPQPRKFAEVYKMGAKLGSGGAPPAAAPRARASHTRNPRRQRPALRSARRAERPRLRAQASRWSSWPRTWAATMNMR